MGVRDFCNSLLRTLKGILSGIEERSIGVVEEELKEMEGAYALLLLGSFIGVPSPPSFVALSLLPLLERELVVALSRSRYIDDTAAYWFEIADI